MVPLVGLRCSPLRDVQGLRHGGRSLLSIKVMMSSSNTCSGVGRVDLVGIGLKYYISTTEIKPPDKAEELLK